MSETSAPWRALEDPPAAGDGARAGAATRSATADAGSARALPRVSWPIAGAMGLAAILLVGAVALALSGGQGSVAADGDGAAVGTRASTPASGAIASGGPTTELVVDVQGAVLRPGVVRIPAGARVADAIAAAGGYGPRVAVERVGQVLNLAAPVHDGDQVVVPSRDDPDAAGGSSAPGGNGGPSASSGASGGGPLDLNHATATELDALPGIGPVTAAKIIAAREEQPFTSVDELGTRKVLGPATLEKIKDLVVVR
jgi:competence protein ComEA